MSSPHQSLDHEPDAATGELPLTSHQAAHAVLFTNELLCDIIGRLPFRDVLSATRTCKVWRDALKDDQHIQQALFLKPMAITEVLCDNYRIKDLEQPISIDDCMIIGKLHPHLNLISGRVLVGNERCIYGRSYPKTDHPEGVWREMFITQPPCKKVNVGIRLGKRLECSTGVTFGDLCDFIHANNLNTPNYQRYPTSRDCVISIRDYAYELKMPRDKPFASICQVRAGGVCRPTGLPLPTDYSDTQSSSGSDN